MASEYIYLNKLIADTFLMYLSVGDYDLTIRVARAKNYKIIALRKNGFDLEEEYLSSVLRAKTVLRAKRAKRHLTNI